ncbi:hypothetical protein MHB85_07795 [Paenibacillus sp. FSL K6-4396]
MQGCPAESASLPLQLLQPNPLLIAPVRTKTTGRSVNLVLGDVFTFYE